MEGHLSSGPCMMTPLCHLYSLHALPVPALLHQMTDKGPFMLAWPHWTGSEDSVRGAGINSVVFYAPVLFSSLGMGQDSALLSSVITGAVFVAATIISILTVDTFGRKVWFTHASCAC